MKKLFNQVHSLTSSPFKFPEWSVNVASDQEDKQSMRGTKWPSHLQLQTPPKPFLPWFCIFILRQSPPFGHIHLPQTCHTCPCYQAFTLLFFLPGILYMSTLQKKNVHEKKRVSFSLSLTGLHLHLKVMPISS